jgi:hypothetical protein
MDIEMTTTLVNCTERYLILCKAKLENNPCVRGQALKAVKD